jgi:superfamily II DNA/RNA helicase
MDLDRLRQVLNYDPETGVFTWRKTIGARARAGGIAGTVKEDGYRIIFVDRQRFAAHRLAWFITFGVWPKADLDHRNMQRDDNRLANLREASRSQNLCNAGARSHNKSGLKGVSVKGSSFTARIKINKQERYLGSFKTAEEAHAAYRSAAPGLHGEFVRFDHG